MNYTKLLSSLTAGLVLGVFEVLASISFAAIIFSKDLSPYLPDGIGVVLFSAAMVGAIASLASSYPGTIAGPQDTTAAILALVASKIAASLSATASGEETFVTVVAAIAFNSLATGIFFFAVGWLRLGELIRFVPYPVIGGFLAATGWMLVAGSIQMMSETHLDFSHLPHLFAPEILLTWLPGMFFAVLLCVVFRRHHSWLILPGMVLGAIATFYLLLWLTGTSVAQAGEYGLLLGPFPAGGMRKVFQLSAVTEANWSIILEQIPTLATSWLIDIMSLLLSVSSIKIVVQRNINLNYELKTAGIASFVSGLGGGLSGFHLFSDTSLVYKLGSAGRLAGLVAATLCAVVLMLGTSTLAFCPKLVVGGLLLFLGLELLGAWVYSTWFKLPKADCFIIILILLVSATVGFL